MVEAAKRLHVKEHVVLDGSGNPVKLAATVECKGIVGSDDRSKSISKNNNVLFLFLNAQWFFWVLEILYKLLLGVLCVCVGGGEGGRGCLFWNLYNFVKLPKLVLSEHTLQC